MRLSQPAAIFRTVHTRDARDAFKCISLCVQFDAGIYNARLEGTIALRVDSVPKQGLGMRSELGFGYVYVETQM